MKRLTTDKPDGNFETMLNFVYGKDGWAHIRHNGEKADVRLAEWAAEQCISREECEDVFRDGVLSEEIDETICDCMMDFPDCPVALSYCFASQAVHLRDRLKMYEDILFSEDGTELISLNQLREIASPPSNPPLTLEELREMDGEFVWVERSCNDRDDFCAWAFVHTKYHVCRPVAGPELFFDDYGTTWRAYRRNPEEG
ncbi:MAG: hypothetical protein K2N78_02760 [Oscillospiraceae bacterium]|nr:hypothetical protein [Oscillospiraceae bacterium]